MTKKQTAAQIFLNEGNHRAPMDAEEFKAIRRRLGWSSRMLGDLLGITEQVVISYEGWKRSIPTGRANTMRLISLCLPATKPQRE